MQARYDFPKTAPAVYKAMCALEGAVMQNPDLEKSLIHLIKIRASQINGCTFCVNMHLQEARADGLNTQQLDLLCVWREAQVFSAKERAVIAWAEVITLVSQTGAPDEDYNAMRQFFTEAQIAGYTLATVAINGWNRLVLTARTVHPVDASATAPAAAAAA
ncbi:AhpD family alkylhydroperoxidase [Advenella incenata]|uniref:AhpD family alkylhydroperoxidase n=1 Tax=Advenella incenata TaxID=267800 RepID=A0A4V2FSD8_9BURK|nr:carboxymuconolactone decarboxylase family protein [Advenella incenata]RZT93929.1 AhpD family alkylhydroperoxidase [Advenella incenata]